MTEAFDPRARAIAVAVLVVGPLRVHRFRFVLDTGSNVTSMRGELLRLLGCDPATAAERRRLRSATGEGQAPIVPVPRFAALGLTRTDFPVAAHDPPPAFLADGLLGLDFFRGRVLTLDFARGRVSLAPRRWWQFWR